MVLDSSVLIAILTNQPVAPRLLAALERDPVRLVSAATVIETSLVMLRRHGDAGDAALDRLLRTLDAEIVAVDRAQCSIARDAAIRFRRGQHPAALNFGDFFPYALARSTGDALLFTGEDFAQTDVVAVAW